MLLLSPRTPPWENLGAQRLLSLDGVTADTMWLSQSLLIAVVAEVPQEPDAHFSIVWPAVVQLPFV